LPLNKEAEPTIEPRSTPLWYRIILKPWIKISPTIMQRKVDVGVEDYQRKQRKKARSFRYNDPIDL
jgi:hypothetical protein